MPRRVIHVGVGGWGRVWCNRFLPANIADGTIECVAAVDSNPKNLAAAKELLSLRDDQCHTSAADAFARHRADFCTLAVPPDVREEIVESALAHDLHILCEKPLADTFAAAQRIAGAVGRAGKKMAVTMSHRFDQDKQTLRAQLRSGAHGRLDYLVCRYLGDFRQLGRLSRYAYDIPHPLMIEMAIHHLDLLADMAGAPCRTIYAQTWNPPWSQFAANSQGLLNMTFANGVRATYEGGNCNAVGLNPWGNEYIRAECEASTLVLSHRRLERFAHCADTSTACAEGTGQTIRLVDGNKWTNSWLIEQFVQWLDGGPEMETNVQANLRSLATVFAGIESAKANAAVDVEDFIRRNALTPD